MSCDLKGDSDPAVLNIIYMIIIMKLGKFAERQK